MQQRRVEAASTARASGDQSPTCQPVNLGEPRMSSFVPPCVRPAKLPACSGAKGCLALPNRMRRVKLRTFLDWSAQQVELAEA
jgi:hypothetical protein